MKGGKGFAPAVTRRRVYPAGACVARGTPSAVFTTRSGGLRSDDLLGWDKKWTSLDLRKAYRQDVPLVLSEERSLFLFFFGGGGCFCKKIVVITICAKSEEKKIITAKSWYQVLPPKTTTRRDDDNDDARRMLNLRRTNAFGAFCKHRWRGGSAKVTLQGTNIFPWERLLGRWFSSISGIWDMRLPRKVDDWGPFWYQNFGP